MASGDTLNVFTPLHSEPPASAFATLDTRNARPVLDFDAATEEAISFKGILPRHYAGGGLSVDIYWMASSATTGSVRWGGAIERGHAAGDDADADSFATEQEATGAANATSGVRTKTTLTFTAGANMDSLAAGEPFRLKLARKVAHADDDMTGDAEIEAIEMRET